MALDRCKAEDRRQSHSIVSSIDNSRETSLSLHPSTWAAFLPPRPQTISLRPCHGDRRLSRPRNHSSSCCPLNPSMRMTRPHHSQEIHDEGSVTKLYRQTKKQLIHKSSLSVILTLAELIESTIFTVLAGRKVSERSL